METPFISRDLDYYKATMGQLEYERHPDAIVTFELKNRSSELLSRYVDPDELTSRLEAKRSGWQPEEIAYLASVVAQDGNAQFTTEYLDFLADNELPPVNVSLDDREELAVATTGPWPLVTFWETVVMSTINELYYEKLLAEQDISLEDLYEEGDRRLDEKIALLKAHPDIKFSDFGTRRRFSYAWQHHVIDRLLTEVPDSMIGTSNIYLAYEHGISPIGTYAHEMPMVYAGLEDEKGHNPLVGHNNMIHDWQERYGSTLSTALTDTFTTEFFLTDSRPEQTERWKAFRHDSGDPFDFGDQLIDWLEAQDIDPTSKTIVFSDGLSIDSIIELNDYFKGRINLLFGWGTTLTNDLGLKANNIVMKATRVNGTPTVKLSDNTGKHTGPVDTVERYAHKVRIATSMGAAAWQALTQKELVAI